MDTPIERACLGISTAQLAGHGLCVAPVYLDQLAIDNVFFQQSAVAHRERRQFADCSSTNQLMTNRILLVPTWSARSVPMRLTVKLKRLPDPFACIAVTQRDQQIPILVFGYYVVPFGVA